MAGVILSLTQLFPTGDLNGASVVKYQPTNLAAMEGLFETEQGAPLAIVGMPDTETGRVIDPIYVPEFLSFLAYGNFRATVDGLNSYSRDLWPPVELTYYCYHIMVGLGTIFIAQMLIGLFLLWRRKLYSSRWFLWMLMLTIPFPYIANEAGWVVSEVGRQPWLVYGMLRTDEGASPLVHSGTVLFTTIGFAGIYLALGLLFVHLITREVAHGPRPAGAHAAGEVSHV